MSKAGHCDYKEDCFYRLKYRGKTSQSENSQMKKMSTRKQSVFIEKVFSSVYNNPCTQAICVRSRIQKVYLVLSHKSMRSSTAKVSNTAALGR